MAVLQPRPCRNRTGLGSCAFARHYWRNHCYFLFLRVLRCFSSPGSLPSSMDDAQCAPGCPIRRSTLVTGICPSAWLIAACHVLLRLREPRHPSCALLSFPYAFEILFCRCFALRRCSIDLLVVICRSSAFLLMPKGGHQARKTFSFQYVNVLSFSPGWPSLARCRSRLCGE